MKCAYHPTKIASVRCSSCERQLCPACDHRIKGYPYCQDCIVAGIEMLRRSAPQLRGVKARAQGKSALIALILGLIPGLGAAYNGQNVKALVHFVATVGLWTIADTFHSPLGIFIALSGSALYFFSLYDAFASAKRHSAGVDLEAEEERLRQFLRERTLVWGSLLVGIGTLAILTRYFPYQVHSLWPLLLVAAGIYIILRGYHRAGERNNTVYRTPPPSVIPSIYDRSTSDLAQAESRYER
jgi:TM2 domain-containing membrane protein YozV